VPTPRILITGGGTGGHLFPGLAIAEALRRSAPGVEIRFAGGTYGLENTVVPTHGYPLYRISVRGLYGVGLRRRLGALLRLPLAFLQSLIILLRFRPTLVLGVGGYASGPMLATALLLGRTCVIQEQNTVPGMTNRLLGRWVRKAFVVVDGMERYFRNPTVVGSPVRRDILALREEPVTPRLVPTVLIVGGSQGALAVNRAMEAALPSLEAWGKPLRIVHQTGPNHLASVQAAYAGRKLEAQVVPFIRDMAGAYRQARLIVSRAGASAIEEIIAARRAALLIPIPGTSGDHQRQNARRLVQAGAAAMLEQQGLTGPALAAAILRLLEDPARVDEMERATDVLFPGDSARRIAEDCLRLVGSP
jgi:UDP-N-acetylglucosamine--N-acetylmuramyl-(pentapeptide) pyrophosphoryl-undecaprenol N-acetylglucosamine transferase